MAHMQHIHQIYSIFSGEVLSCNKWLTFKIGDMHQNTQTLWEHLAIRHVHWKSGTQRVIISEVYLKPSSG